MMLCVRYVYIYTAHHLTVNNRRATLLKNWQSKLVGLGFRIQNSTKSVYFFFQKSVALKRTTRATLAASLLLIKFRIEKKISRSRDSLAEIEKKPPLKRRVVLVE